MREVQVSGMRFEDISEVTAIERQCFSEPWSESGFRSALEQGCSVYFVARTRDSNQIAGYCGLLRSFEEAEILNVAVRGELRGQGIGTTMLSQLMEYGKKRGIRRFTLEVRKGNTAAIHLYEKLGFVSVGIRKHFYRMPEEDAVIMWTPEPDETLTR
ncbi:MAG: ribosomal protein S18-alanine N-acetyltransferase [Lachnospiraceae bacterium]|nr:ribosomal protein S18-alanine N-acetyltransferase [Lachnospiraceae bacterium]